MFPPEKKAMESCSVGSLQATEDREKEEKEEKEEDEGDKQIETDGNDTSDL